MLNTQAMFNIAFMHQFGIGLRKDFHLAERYYDMAVASDFRALVPCQLALAGLQLHRLFDGEALPEYLLVADLEVLAMGVVAAAVFVLSTYLMVM